MGILSKNATQCATFLSVTDREHVDLAVDLDESLVLPTDYEPSEIVVSALADVFFAFNGAIQA